MNRRKWQIRGMQKILIISSRNWNNASGDKKRKKIMKLLIKLLKFLLKLWLRGASLFRKKNTKTS